VLIYIVMIAFKIIGNKCTGLKRVKDTDGKFEIFRSSTQSTAVIFTLSLKEKEV
jgi:hypothetical protein